MLYSVLILLGACHPKNREASLAILPPLTMLLIDSTATFKTQDIPKGRPIVLLFFRPDCPHCRQETQDLLNNINLFKDVRFYMISVAPLQDIREFNLQYNLIQYKNIMIGKDQERGFIHIFHPGQIPYLAIYDGNKKLIKIYNGGARIDYIYKATHF